MKMKYTRPTRPSLFHRAGDPYPVTESMVADGIGTIIASLFGSPFATVMYFGHPAYKKSGAKTGFRFESWKGGSREGSDPGENMLLLSVQGLNGVVCRASRNAEGGLRVGQKLS